MMENGHKILLFSQFPSALKLLAKELDKRKIKYAYLDGATSIFGGKSFNTSLFLRRKINGAINSFKVVNFSFPILIYASLPYHIYNLENVTPISDIDGKMLLPYTFTLENICTTDTNYVINLETLPSGEKILANHYVQLSLQHQYVDLMTSHI